MTAFGETLIWLIDPRARTVTVIERSLAVSVLGESDVLEGGDIVKGFSCPVRELFLALAR